MAALMINGLPTVFSFLTFLGIPLELPLSSRDVTETTTTPAQIYTSSSTVCEHLAIERCRGVGYNYTVFPNGVGQSTQLEADLQMSQYYPLVAVNCSVDLLSLLCSVYAPKCDTANNRHQPCRRLCESAKKGCSTLMEAFGFKWPREMNCAQFPENGPCVDQPLRS